MSSTDKYFIVSRASDTMFDMPFGPSIAVKEIVILHSTLNTPSTYNFFYSMSKSFYNKKALLEMILSNGVFTFNF